MTMSVYILLMAEVHTAQIKKNNETLTSSVRGDLLRGPRKKFHRPQTCD